MGPNTYVAWFLRYRTKCHANLVQGQILKMLRFLWKWYQIEASQRIVCYILNVGIYWVKVRLTQIVCAAGQIRPLILSDYYKLYYKRTLAIWQTILFYQTEQFETIFIKTGALSEFDPCTRLVDTFVWPLTFCPISQKPM